jgi:hypothetical protein
MLPDTPWPKGVPAPWTSASPEGPTLRGLDAATLSREDHDQAEMSLSPGPHRPLGEAAPWTPASPEGPTLRGLDARLLLAAKLQATDTRLTIVKDFA